jgi:hypothetical protein
MDPTKDQTPPYILVHSRSQESLARTGNLPEQVKSEFTSATYADMSLFIATTLKDRPDMDFGAEEPFFMVLDEQSKEDRNVVLISKGSACLYADEENEDGMTDEEMREVMWRRHRIPFEKACFFWLVLASKLGTEGDEFLLNVTRETAEGL